MDKNRRKFRRKDSSDEDEGNAKREEPPVPADVAQRNITKRLVKRGGPRGLRRPAPTNRSSIPSSDEEVEVGERQQNPSAPSSKGRSSVRPPSNQRQAKRIPSKSGVNLSFADDADDLADDMPSSRHRFRRNVIRLTDSEPSEQPRSKAAAPVKKPQGGGEYTAESLEALRKVNQASNLRAPLTAGTLVIDEMDDEEEMAQMAQAIENVNRRDEGDDEELPDTLDAESIQMIKQYKQRQRKLKEGAETEPEQDRRADEFIPLNNGEAEDKKGISGPSIAARVVKLGTAALRRKLLEEQKTDEDEVEMKELEQWEVEMMKRGGKMSDKLASSLPRGGGGAVNGTARPAARRTKPRSLAEIEQALQKSFLETQADNDKNQRTLSKLNADIQATENELTSLQKELTTISQQFEFFQEARDYVKDLCACLRSKVPLIREVEDAVVHLLREHQEALYARHKQDVIDRLEDARRAGISLKHNSEGFKGLEKGGEQDASPSDPDEDFAGRDKSYFLERQRGIRQQERWKRYRERSARVLLCLGLGDGHERKLYYEAFQDGMETDAMPEETVSTLRTRLDRLREASEVIFEDVVEEFSELEYVVKRFEEWKRKFPKNYDDAFCSLSLPDIFSPYVRVQMIPWYPFLPSSLSSRASSAEYFGEFERFSWFKLLFSYAQDIAVEPAHSKNDQDANLVPNILQKSVTDIFCNHVREVWDPFSSRQTKHGVEVFTELVEVFQVASDSVDKVLAAVFATLQRTAKLLVVPVPEAGALSSESQAADEEIIAFSAQQYAHCVKHQKSTAAWIAVTPVSQSKWLALLAAQFLKILVDHQLPYLGHLVDLREHQLLLKRGSMGDSDELFLLSAEELVKMFPSQGISTHASQAVQKVLSRFEGSLRRGSSEDAKAAEKLETVLALMTSLR